MHEHEATAAIGLIQRLHEALNHERGFYAVFANLQAPSTDLVVLTEMGMGVIELKLIKRSGYGRAGFDLLRLKVLER